MESNGKSKKNKMEIKIRPIISLLIGLTFFTLIIIIAFFEAGNGQKSGSKKNNRKSSNIKAEEDLSSAYNNADSNSYGIILEINKTDKIIRLYDIDQKAEINLNYTGATNILDKYGQAIAIGQVEIGLIVDVAYESHNKKLISLQTSSRAWEYIGVNNMTLEPDNKIIKIANAKYTYENPVVIDNDKFITMEDLAIQDELTIRGIDKTIWSVIVTKGHGTVKLKDYEAFLGGSITVGYEAVQEITEDMTITVREGNYNLTVENGEYSGTKNITVYRNQETIVSLGDLGPEEIEYGHISFEITPFGADLFIDGEITPYANPIKLAYGEHNIEVSLGGYLTYQGILKVDKSHKKIQITLPQLSSRDSVSVIETQPDEEEIEGESDIDSIVDMDHLIYIQNPSGVSVYLNGEFKGISPVSFQKVIGSHVLTFIKQGYKTKSYTINIADDGLDTYISLPDLQPKN